jgi:crossover junction endodeoxyribonuclease RuvC
MKYIGIDPGLSGAIAIIDNGDIRFFDTPVLEIVRGKSKKREYNVNSMADFIIHESHSSSTVEIKVGLEKTHSMPGQGVRSMFSMGEGFGIWKGIIAARQLSLELITPQAWKKAMMSGMGKDKDASRQKALQRLYNYFLDVQNN